MGAVALDSRFYLVREADIEEAREFWDEIKDLPGFSVQDVSWDLDEGRIPLGGDLDPAAFEEWTDPAWNAAVGDGISDD